MCVSKWRHSGILKHLIAVICSCLLLFLNFRRSKWNVCLKFSLWCKKSRFWLTMQLSILFNSNHCWKQWIIFLSVLEMWSFRSLLSNLTSHYWVGKSYLWLCFWLVLYSFSPPFSREHCWVQPVQFGSVPWKMHKICLCLSVKDRVGSSYWWKYLYLFCISLASTYLPSYCRLPYENALSTAVVILWFSLATHQAK